MNLLRKIFGRVYKIFRQTKIIEHRLGMIEDQLSEALVILKKIEMAVGPPLAVSAKLTLMGDEGTVVMQLKDNQPGSYAVQIEDAAGNPAPLDPSAVPAWSISDPSIATLTPSADGLSCAVQPSGKLGSAQVQFSIPAVNNEPAIQASDDLLIVAGDATQAILVGTPG